MKLENSNNQMEKTNATNFLNQLRKENFELENNFKEIFNKNEETEAKLSKVIYLIFFNRCFLVKRREYKFKVGFKKLSKFFGNTTFKKLKFKSFVSITYQ